MRIQIATPKGRSSGSGNWTTADRWASLLRDSGHEVSVTGSWQPLRDPDSEMLIALHARRSHDSIVRFVAAHPERPLVVALTGTDLYHDIHEDAGARESLDAAWRLIVLQERGPNALPALYRDKTRVIYQSAAPLTRSPDPETFTALVLGNLRPEKDPFRTALASRLLRDDSRLRVLHVGGADEAREREAIEHERRSSRYRWLGKLAPDETRELLARSHVLIQSSNLEGGANAVGEALAAGLPVIASDIPGNVGMLGVDYSGYYPVGDERALAALLQRVEDEPDFRAKLERSVLDRAHLVGVERERAALDALVEEVSEEAESKRRGPRYTRRMEKRERIRLTKYSTKAG